MKILRTDEEGECDTRALTRAGSGRRCKRHGAGGMDKERLLAGFQWKGHVDESNIHWNETKVSRVESVTLLHTQSFAESVTLSRFPLKFYLHSLLSASAASNKINRQFTPMATTFQFASNQQTNRPNFFTNPTSSAAQFIFYSTNILISN